MSRVRIIGVGTPFGDDRAGLEIAARLLAVPPRDCEVVATARPGVELIDLFVGADAVILLDAVRSGAATGTLHDLALDDLPQPGAAGSSHGIGIADTLALARALGRLPRGRLVGIECGRGSATIGAPLSTSVAAALSPAAMRARAWAERYGDNDRAGDGEDGDR
jgi:hydrogenase maturation protease